MPTNNALEQIRKRRKAYWLWVPFGAMAGLSLIMLYKFTIGVPPKWFFNTLNFLWVVIDFVLLLRLTAVRCPSCGKPALRASLLFTSLDKLRCYHCDYKLSN